MRVIRGIAGKLQSKIRFHRGADVARATFVQRPATVVVLSPTQIICDILLAVRIDGPHEVLQEKILGRNGCVGLQFEQPMAVTGLARR